MTRTEELILNMLDLISRSRNAGLADDSFAIKEANKFTASLTAEELESWARHWGNREVSPEEFRESLTNHIYDEIGGYE